MTGTELTEIRKRLGLSQKDLAFKFEIRRQHLSDLENGKHVISKAIQHKISLLQIEGNTKIPILPKGDTPTRIEPCFSDPQNGSLGLPKVALEKITFCQGCGAPFRIDEPGNRKVKPLIPREGDVPGDCPICFKSMVVSQERRGMVGIEAGSLCPKECFEACRYRMGRARYPKCSLGLIPVVISDHTPRVAQASA